MQNKASSVQFCSVLNAMITVVTRHYPEDHGVFLAMMYLFSIDERAVPEHVGRAIIELNAIDIIANNMSTHESEDSLPVACIG